MNDENKNINNNTDDIDMPDLTSNHDSGDNTDGDKEALGDNIIIAKSKAALIKNLLRNIKDSSEQVLKLLEPSLLSETEERISISQFSDEKFSSAGTEAEISSLAEDGEAKIIEGVFDGENMIGPDGKVYSVPANYASKSKLVEGDIMKLTITANGTFIYKQIGPIERTRIVGSLEKEGDTLFVAADGKKWRVLTASVTYYKGEPGDEVVIMVPKGGESKWAAVENIVKNY